MSTRKPYPSDVSDEEWAFVAPYLALLREDAPQLTHDLREVLNGLRWVVRTGSAWRYCPTTCHRGKPSTSRRGGGSLPASSRRWSTICTYSFATFRGQGARADGGDTRLSHSTLHPGEWLSGRLRRSEAKEGRKKVHAAVDTLGHLLALFVTPASEQDREQMGELTRAIQEETGESVELAYVDQGYTGERAAEEAEAHVISLEVVKHPEAKRGFVLLPRRWVVERDFAWASRFRRLAKDYERLPTVWAGLHFVAFACPFLRQATGILGAGP